MTRDRAAYMRDYRAKNRSAPTVGAEGADLRQAHERIAELEAEVARLKRELATRPAIEERQPGTFPLTREELGLGTSTILPYQRDSIRDPMREFHPVPKLGKKGK